MKIIAYILAGGVATATLAIGLHSMSRPYSISALGFIVWAVSPYSLLALLIKATKSKAAIFGVLALCILTSLFGLGLIIDAMYIHLDAQGGLIFIFAPLWQWVGLFILAIPVLILNMVNNA